MNINNFNNEIKNILEEGSIESIPLKNVDILNHIILDKDFNKKLYSEFKKNFENINEADDDWFLLKLQDMIYRVNLLTDQLISNNDKTENDIILNNIVDIFNQNDYPFFDAVSYDDNDIEEIEASQLFAKEKLEI